VLLPAILWLVLTSPLRADIIYTVDEGDSAWSIAIHFGVTLEALYAANGWASDENPVLQVGQKVAVPSDREDSSGSSEGTSPETTYIVQPGDNPYMIAHRHGIGVLALLEFNNLTEDDFIQPGQLLSIPGGSYEYQGNAESEASSEAQAEPAPEPLHYRVQEGDNAWGIARQFGINVQTLLAFNSLDQNAVLHIGDELLVPLEAGSLPSRSNAWGRYTVARGDTLIGIAQANQVSLAALAQANNLEPNGVLHEGQQLLIPNYRSTQAPSGASPTETPPVTPPAPQDLSGSVSPLPAIPNLDGTLASIQDLDGWHSEMFDFTRIEVPQPSTPEPEPVSEGGLSVDGHFNDGTPYYLYTVRRGDTLGGVAGDFGITQSEMMSRNGLDARSTLRIGRDLKISLPRPPARASHSGSSGSIHWGAPSVPIGDGTGTATGQAIVEEASKHIGTPYVWSGTSLTGGVDCSGFTMAVFAQFGISLPHRACDQAECGTSVEYTDLVPGDLVFFHTTRSGISHVGIYIGGGEFIHASSYNGRVIINRLDSGHYNERFVCARRVL